MGYKNTNLINNPSDILFIYFPFWFSLIYLLLLLNLPYLGSILFFIILFLFAETHFASTWLFFFDRQNWQWVNANLYHVQILPLFLLLSIAGLWFFNPNVVLIFHYLASGWHVTRQSVAISKLPNKGRSRSSIYIYLPSLIFIAIGLYQPGILSDYLTRSNINIVISFLFLLYFILIYSSFYIHHGNKFKSILSVITGIFIYLPILFIDDLAIATAVGVGMHWIQYIYLVWIINIRKLSTKFKSLNQTLKSSAILRRIGFVITYSLIMTTLTFFGMPKKLGEEVNYSLLYLIPILFQLYHFYIDAYIWKFSDSHIRSSVGAYITRV